MYGELRGHTDFAGQVTADAVAALRHVTAAGHLQPLLLGYYPVARINPFQALLYGHSWEEGVAPVPVLKLEAMRELLPFRDRGATVGLHLHWSSNITAPATSPAHADALVRGFLEELDGFLDDGGRFLWTVHNRLPHGARFIDAETRLRQGLADRADLIHVLTTHTVELMEGIATLPQDRVLHVPHPAYTGAYPDITTRLDSRWELGLDPDELAYAFIGSIQPYKGLDRLLASFRDLRDAEPSVRRRLLVAGEPSGDVQWAIRQAALDRDVVLHATRVSMNDVQRWMHAADVVVLPYLEALNSGVLILALTFGVPVIAPDLPTVRELVDDRCAILFDPADSASLASALGRASELVGEDARAAALAAAARFEPHEVSRQFAQQVRKRLT